MAKPPKGESFSTALLASVLLGRGLRADVFSGGIHMRIPTYGVDIWPTVGRWKWMNDKFSGTLTDFCTFLDQHPERLRMASAAFNFKS